jgi:hypothetical protein
VSREHAKAFCQQPKRWHHPKMADTLSFLGRSEQEESGAERDEATQARSNGGADSESQVAKVQVAKVRGPY